MKTMFYFCYSRYLSFLRDMKGMLWHSNAIVDCIAHNQVRTSSGSIYLLQGNIDSASMRKEGKKMILNVMLQTEKGFRFMIEHTAEVNILSDPANWARWVFQHMLESDSSVRFRSTI